MTDVTDNLILPPDPVQPSKAKTSKKPVKKVAAAGISGVALVVIVGILNGIDPHIFDSLGIWGPVVSAGVVALGAFLGGYIKKS